MTLCFMSFANALTRHYGQQSLQMLMVVETVTKLPILFCFYDIHIEIQKIGFLVFFFHFSNRMSFKNSGRS